MQLLLAGERRVVATENDLVSLVRDLKSFHESKQIKREPLRYRADGAGSGSCKPVTHRGFRLLRERLRQSAQWGRPSEWFDRLERELMARHDASLPVPESVTQREDGVLSMRWPGLTAMAQPDRFGYLLGGATGQLGTGISRQLIEALHVRATLADQ